MFLIAALPLRPLRDLRPPSHRVPHLVPPPLSGYMSVSLALDLSLSFSLSVHLRPPPHRVAHLVPPPRSLSLYIYLSHSRARSRSLFMSCHLRPPPNRVLHLVPPPPSLYRVTSLIRTRTPLRPYRRPMSKVLGVLRGWASSSGRSTPVCLSLSLARPVSFSLSVHLRPPSNRFPRLVRKGDSCAYHI